LLQLATAITSGSLLHDLSELGRIALSTRTASADVSPDRTADAPGFLVVEDHPLFRAALLGVIGTEFPRSEVRQAISIGEALDSIASHGSPDLILLDLSMPGTTGLLGAYRVRVAAPRSALVIVSAHEDPRIVGGSIALGISGYILKSTPKAVLTPLLHDILGGAICLPGDLGNLAAAKDAEAEVRDLIKHLGRMTPKQLRVLDMICQGVQNKHVAHELDISVLTVKQHVTEILRKLDVRSRTEAIIALSKLQFGKPHSEIIKVETAG
jgi:DNA-binding NarL/FixJ family response regulator